MTAHMPAFMNQVVWEPVAPEPRIDGLPTVTHEGVFDIGEHKLRCYRLDDGRAIINADDFNAFFGLAEKP